jgi:hypothetical protein
VDADVGIVMSDTRQLVRVRAKSVLKLDTGQSDLDYTYDRSSPVDGIAKNMIHAVVFNKGITEARKFIDEYLATYDEDYRDE